MKKSDIQVRISEYQKEISKCQFLLKKGSPNPSELRNTVIDFRVEIQRLQKQLEVC